MRLLKVEMSRICLRFVETEKARHGWAASLSLHRVILVTLLVVFSKAKA